jgi:hypothetical protein
MINRRFMIVPPALPSGGHAEPLEQTSKDFLCLLLEMANMRVPRVVHSVKRKAAPGQGNRISDLLDRLT